MKIGIDMGTTYSLVARVDNQKVSLFPDRNIKNLVYTPSVVVTRSHSAFVGRAALDLLMSATEPAVAFIDIKRQLATPFMFRDAEGREWPPEALSALILRKMALDASAGRGGRLEGAVLTIPANFYDRQRQAAEQAAKIAGLELIGLLEEPVAAAFNYGLSRESRDCEVLVYDWGGGTFDAAVVTIEAAKRVLYVHAKAGLERHGGRDIDALIRTMVHEQYQARRKEPLKLTQRADYQLTRLIEHELKVDLFAEGGPAVVRKHLVLPGAEFEVRLQRAEFEERVGPLVDRTIEKALECVGEAGLTPAQIDRVLLVGGTSMLPLVRQKLEQAFGARDAQGRLRILADQQLRAVVQGAALKANEEGIVVAQDVSSHNLGVMVHDATGAVPRSVIPRGTRVGTQHTLTLYWQGADRLGVHVVEFNSPDATRTVDQYEITRRPAPAAGTPIELTFRYEGSGRVLFEARDPARDERISHRPMSGGETNREEESDLVAAWSGPVREMLINGAMP